MPDGGHSADDPLFCDRCLAELRPGRGEFYEVRIEAVADPSLEITTDDLQRDHAAEFARLLAIAGDQSERELMDQVYRRLTIHLCTACYRHWIENPAGV